MSLPQPLSAQTDLLISQPVLNDRSAAKEQQEKAAERQELQERQKRQERQERQEHLLPVLSSATKEQQEQAAELDRQLQAQANARLEQQAREHSSAVERCGPHVVISPVMLRSSNARLEAAGAAGGGAGAEAGTGDAAGPGTYGSLPAACVWIP